MGMLTDVLVILHISTYWQNIFIGVLIIVAVSFDTYRRKIRFIPDSSRRLTQKDVFTEKPDLKLIYEGAGVSIKNILTNEINDKPLLKLQGITKYFGYVHALDNVDLDIYQGEIMALVGDNGAGKSTLVKIASGSINSDQGNIFFKGSKIKFDGPKDATAKGVSML